MAFASAGSFTVVDPVGSDRLKTVFDPCASASLTAFPEALETDRTTSVWPPIATPGGVSTSPAPIFSLTTKCGVGLGGWVCVWLELELELELVVRVREELVAGAVAWLLEALEVVEVDAETEAEAVAGAEVDADVEALTDAAAADVELEWPLEPHAATSSAGASANPIRLNIGAS